MIRTGEDYRASIRDDRRVHIGNETVTHVTTHPIFKPLVDIRARVYDMAHDPATAPVMTIREDGAIIAVGNALPRTAED